MALQKEWDKKTSEELLEEYRKTKDQTVKQELVLRYVYIVKTIAMQMRGVYATFAQVDDIINEGVIALMAMIDRYDPSRNVKFETYVSKRIRGLIIDIARKQDWIPRSVRKNAKDIDNAITVLFNRLGRYPTYKEIAGYLHISVEKYLEGLGKTNMSSFMSLEALIEDSYTNEKRSQALNVTTESVPEEYLEAAETENMLKKALEQLRDNEKLVISLYYKKELSMKEIASVMEVSEPRISQIHANALKKMKLYLEKYLKEE